MAFDTSFYSQIKPLEIANPLAQAAQIAQLQGAQSQNRLADLVFGEKQREVAENAALNDAYKGAFGPDGKLDRAKFIAKAIESNLGSKLPGMQKTWAEQDKGEAELNKAKLEAQVKAAQQHRDALNGVNTYEDAVNWVKVGYSDPILKDVFGRSGRSIMQAASAIPQDPQGFLNWKRQNALGAEKYIEMTLPKIEFKDTGGKLLPVQMNPALPGYGGAAQGVSAIGKTMTPGESARLAQDDKHFQANFNKPIFNAEAGGFISLPTKSNPNGALTKVPGVEGKAPTEFQGKAAMFGARAEAADKILSNLEGQGVTNTGVIKSVVSGAGGMVPFIGDKVSSALNSGMNTVPSLLGGPNAQQQQVEQARRDFVNAVLRLESGASISQGEFENAAKQYFPQPGDSKEVIAQKAQNRKLAIAGLNANAGKTVVKVPATKGPADILKQADSILGL